jgi:hypothetical protein
MAPPTKPTVPDAPLRSAPATFSAKLEDSLVFWPTFATYLNDTSTYTLEQAEAALAAATIGGLPSLSGHALEFFRINAASDAIEFLTPTEVLSALGAASAALAAPLASPPLTGIPTAPTAAASTNTTQLATTAQVRLAIPDVLNAGGSAPVYGCRAWVNFNGSGVVAIRGSGNVSSITDNGIGDYTINLATALTDVNYSLSLACRNEVNDGDTAINVKRLTTPTSSSVTIQCTRFNNGEQDPAFVYAQFFR